MSELLDKQFRFCEMISDLIPIIRGMGYFVKFAPDGQKHMVNSLHYQSLAKDLQLFKADDSGKLHYLTHTLDYKPVGEAWEAMGGDWGGRFGESQPGAGDGHDGNHFSLEHEGVR